MSASENTTGVPTSARAKETWTFDDRGRWVRRIVSTWTGSSYTPQYTNRFLWDENVLLAILTESRLVKASFMRGLGNVVAISLTTNGLQFTVVDGNKSVAAVVSGTDGRKSGLYEYETYGRLLRITGSAARENPIRFGGEFANDVFGSFKYLYRDQQPSVGRWLSRDPLANTLGRAFVRETMNPLAFLQNTPLGRRDHLGLHGNPISGPNGPVPPGPPWYCPSTCGKDYTTAVKAEITSLRTFIDGFPYDQIDGWTDLLKTMLWAGLVAARLNYDEQLKGIASHPFTGCPSVPCSGTITLCGKCVTQDVPGNVMFGFIREAIIGNFAGNVGAMLAEMLDFDGEFLEEDIDVFPAGNQLYKNGSDDICSVMGLLPDRVFRNDCMLCSQLGAFPRPFPFLSRPYPTTFDY